MKIKGLDVNVEHPRAPTIRVAAELDDGTNVSVLLHSDEIHGCLEPTLGPDGKPLELDKEPVHGVRRPAHFTPIPILAGIVSRVQARVDEAKSPAAVAERVALADQARKDQAHAAKAAEQATIRAKEMTDKARQAEALKEAHEAESARLKLENTTLTIANNRLKKDGRS